MARTFLESNMLATLQRIEGILTLPHLHEARKRSNMADEIQALDERIAEIEAEMGIPDAEAETVEA